MLLAGPLRPRLIEDAKTGVARIAQKNPIHELSMTGRERLRNAPNLFEAMTNMPPGSNLPSSRFTSLTNLRCDQASAHLVYAETAPGTDEVKKFCPAAYRSGADRNGEHKSSWYWPRPHYSAADYLAWTIN